MSVRRTVLVVDPNPNTRERVAAAIGADDFEVVQAKDAQDAQVCAANKNVVLVLACASLPHGNGYDLAKALRLTHPRTVVFLLSGGFEAYDSGRAQAAGVAGRIPKPFSPDTLLFHIHAAVGALSNLGEDLPVVEPDDLFAAESRADPAVAESGGERRATRGEAEPPVFDGALMPISEEAEPERPVAPEKKKAAARRPPGVPDTNYRPPTTSERIATFLPRDYEDLPRVSVDPAVVGPALEKAILEVLPEVVEIVLRRALATSDSFRDIVTKAVEDAISKELPGMLGRAPSKRPDEAP